MISRKEMRTTSQDSGQAKRIGCLYNPTLQLKVFLNEEYCATCAAIACGGELQECLERIIIHEREVLDKVCGCSYCRISITPADKSRYTYDERLVEVVYSCDGSSCKAQLRFVLGHFGGPVAKAFLSPWRRRRRP